MVGLASELEGKPFHLIASYNQRGSRGVALREIFQNGLGPVTPNVTVTLQSRHPGVRGITYVPYYLVFDHHGVLVYHHQGGPYHGGDRNAVLERVRSMIAEVPAIYVGRTPYSKHQQLAKSIASGENLGPNLTQLAELVAKSPSDTELKLLVAAVERHAKVTTRKFERDVALDEKRALGVMESTAKAYRGTPWGAALVARAAKLDRSAKNSYAAAATELGAARNLWSELRSRTGNRGQVRNPFDVEFRAMNQEALAQLAAKLQSLSRDHADSSAGDIAASWLSLLRR